MPIAMVLLLSFWGGSNQAPLGPTAEDRHAECDAASEKSRSNCDDACATDDKSIVQIEECKAACKKDATKVYWNCSSCWTDCGKALEQCAQKCPQPAPTPGIQPSESTLGDDPDCFELCQLEQVKCQDTCKDAQP